MTATLSVLREFKVKLGKIVEERKDQRVKELDDDWKHHEVAILSGDYVEPYRKQGRNSEDDWFLELLETGAEK